MFSLRKSDARWPLKSLLYCIITALVTVSHLEMKIRSDVITTVSKIKAFDLTNYQFQTYRQYGGYVHLSNISLALFI